MNDKLPNTEAITALVDSLESHEGAMTERERQLCTTLLHGLAAAGRLRPEPTPESGDLPDWDYSTASEEMRWSYDQGHEAGWQARLDPTTMSWDDVEDALRASIAYIDRLRDEQATPPESRGRIEFEGAAIELPDNQ